MTVILGVPKGRVRVEKETSMRASCWEGKGEGERWDSLETRALKGGGIDKAEKERREKPGMRKSHESKLGWITRGSARSTERVMDKKKHPCQHAQNFNVPAGSS